MLGKINIRQNCADVLRVSARKLMFCGIGVHTDLAIGKSVHSLL